MGKAVQHGTIIFAQLPKQASTQKTNEQTRRDPQCPQQVLLKLGQSNAALILRRSINEKKGRSRISSVGVIS